MTVIDRLIKKIGAIMTKKKQDFLSGMIVTKTQRITFQISVKELKK